MTVDSSEQEAAFEKAAFLTLLEYTVDADKSGLSGRRADHSHYSGTVLVLAGSKRPL